MARIKFSIVAQKEYYSDELHCRVFISSEFSMLNRTRYFVILFLLFKNASLFSATKCARDCESWKMTELQLRPIFATVC